MRLADKVAIVTGSGQGIGMGIAKGMAAQGASVVVSGRTPEKIRNVVEDISKSGGKAIAVKADVTKRAEVRALVAAAIEAYGRVDILVNNAITRRRATFFELTDEDWDIVLATGVKGVFNCVQAVARHMMERRYGRIVNVSSIAAMGVSYPPNEFPMNYGAAKAAVNQMTKMFARELGPYGITVNGLAPGSIETAESMTKRSREDAERNRELRSKAAVLGRQGTPEEMAALAVFLASDECPFMTGQTLFADGGRTDYML